LVVFLLLRLAIWQTEQPNQQPKEEWHLKTKNGTHVHIISRGHTSASQFPANALKVATVREPVERLLSAFSFVHEGGSNHPNQRAVQQARRWQPFLQEFKTFSAFLQDRKAVERIMDPNDGHTHFHALRPWLATGQKLDVDVTIRQTHLTEDFKQLLGILQLEAPLSLLKKQPKQQKANDAGVVPKYNVTSKRFKLDLTEGSSDAEQVQRLLSDDIELYNMLIDPVDRQRRERQARNKVARAFKVFVIGGHKNGTLCLHKWFETLGWNSVHGQHWIKNPRLISQNDVFSDNFAGPSYRVGHKPLALTYRVGRCSFQSSPSRV
jgi:hypothetical protein